MTSKYFLSIALLPVTMMAHGQANWNDSTFVHRDGMTIKDGSGDIIQLEGPNLGGWLMWEGWLWNGGFTQQKTIFNSMQNELGAAAAIAFRDSIYLNYITEDDIAQIAQKCLNVARIPINHELLEDDFNPYIYKPEGWAVLDSALAWCEMHNVYAILDLHSAPGGQSTFFTADPDLFINLWNGTINQTRTAALWKAIADRYKDRGIVAGYDLLNEPDPPTDIEMLNMYERIVDSIRVVDNNHMLFIEGSALATDFSVFTALIDPNMTYEFHLYSWFITDIAAEVQHYTDLSQAQDVPVWCGEWGENTYTELDTTLRIFRDPAFGISGSSFWTWKKAKRISNYPFYLGVDTTALWNKTIQWIGNNFLPQPSAADMQIGMNEFLTNIKWSNCVWNDTLGDLLQNCGTVGLSPLSKYSDIQVYPNPTNGRFTILLDDMHDAVTVNVVDVNGKLMHAQRFRAAEQIAMDLYAEPGLYFVELITPTARYTTRILLQ